MHRKKRNTVGKKEERNEKWKSMKQKKKNQKGGSKKTEKIDN